MNERVTRVILDAETCADPDCQAPHGTKTPLFLHGACHPTVPTWAVYEDGVMTMRCAECDTFVMSFLVADTVTGVRPSNPPSSVDDLLTAIENLLSVIQKHAKGPDVHLHRLVMSLHDAVGEYLKDTAGPS